MTPEPNIVRNRIDELVNAEIDGVITPAESTELAALLAENPAENHYALQSRAQLRELAGVLSQVEALEPPEALQRELLAALPVRRVPAQHPGLLSLIREALVGRRVLVYGYGLAAILLLAFVGKEFISPVETVGDKDGLTGTMAPKDSRPTATEPSFPDVIDFDQHGLAGSIRLVRQAAGVLVEVDATSDNPVVLELSYDAALLTLGGDVPTEDGLIAWTETALGQLFLGGEGMAGLQRHAYQVQLSEMGENGPATVHFRFVESGDPVFEGSLALEVAGSDPAHGSRK